MTPAQLTHKRNLTASFIRANREKLTIREMAKELGERYGYVHDVAERNGITVKAEERKLPESEAAPGCFCIKQYFFNNATY